MKIISGVTRRIRCLAETVPSGVSTRRDALISFSKEITPGEIRPVRVASDQTEIEGSFWLAKIISACYENEEETTFAGEIIGAGFLVVRIQWFEFMGSSTRFYAQERAGVARGVRTGPSRPSERDMEDVRSFRLLPEEHLIATSAFARIGPVKFKETGGGIYVLD